MLYFILLFFACADSQKTPAKDCPQCPECPQAEKSPSKSTALTATEMDLISASLEDIRAGIRGFDDQSIGICKGSGKNCEQFLGQDAADLPEGNYVLYAKLLAPKIKKGKGWQVDYSKECKTIKKNKNGESVTNNTYSKEYHIGSNPKGWRLAPLATIKSPGKYGRQECSWKLTFHNVNGTEEITGSWSVPEQQ